MSTTADFAAALPLITILLDFVHNFIPHNPRRAGLGPFVLWLASNNGTAINSALSRWEFAHTDGAVQHQRSGDGDLFNFIS